MNTSKISLVLIVAAVAAFAPSLKSGEVIIKRGARDLQSPSTPLFVEKATPVKAMVCPACKAEFASTVTQDSKLRTKTVLVENHACNSCKTAIVRTGAQKATVKDVSQHTCGGMMATAETCCAMR